jgi:FAD synthase
VRVRWLRRLRAETKFADLAALRTQIGADVAAARLALGLEA